MKVPLSELSVSGQQAPDPLPDAPDRNRLLPDPLHHDNIIDLPGQPGDVLSPVPSLAERGKSYEYI